MFNVKQEGPLYVVYDDATNVTIKECGSAQEAAAYVATEKAGDVGNLAKHLVKKHGTEHLFTACMSDEATAEYSGDARKAVCARVHHAAIGKWPSEKEMKEMEVTEGRMLSERDLKEAAGKPGDYLIVEDEAKPTTWHLQVRKNGTPDHGLMGGAWAALHEGYRGNKYEGPNKGEAIGKLKKMYEAEKMPIPGESEAKKEAKPNILEQVIAALKGDAPGHPFRGNQFGSGGGGDGGSVTQHGNYQIEEKPHPTEPGKKVYHAREGSGSNTSDILDSDESKGELVKRLDKRDSDIARASSERASLSAGASKRAEEWAKKHPESAKRAQDFFEGKEGRRNSGTDEGRLQQIHDLSVENGAQCMVMKDAKGASRWVLISSNAYEDRDNEIVSRKALKKDVARMRETGQYGPLRLWHLGYPDVEKKEAGPGVDIGDCDYSEMFGKFNVESGTFRNERVAAAIKERADQWGTSRGFFHSPDDPDREGVYHEIHTFERSLLPKQKASNSLTPLASVIKENEMTTKEDKLKQLSDLLGGDDLAKQVLGAVDAAEKQAQERGLTYKQQAESTAEVETKSGDKKDGKEPDEDDMDGMDEATAKAYKAMLPHIVKTIHALTKKANIEDSAEREAKAAKKEKAKAKRKELEDKIEALETQLKELTGEQPRILSGGYRASQSDQTILNKAMLKDVNQADPLGDFLTGLGMFKQG